ncbi:MAG: sporulation peptidase YabG [Clostridia bacterium]|nr:sporulation peptidase YabG [Clostridia bacterium]
MDSFMVGDIVARKSYNMDVIFKIVNINGTIADLQGVTVRISADSNINDLVHISESELNTSMKNFENSRNVRLDRCFSHVHRTFNLRNENYTSPLIYTKEKILKKPGIILHIDGDAEYTEKCKENYRRMGLTAYVYNIAEQEQYKYVYNLLQQIRPNILILTGHDAFFRRKNDMYDINNYRNSKYFVRAVIEARKYEHNLDNLVIFAGACQSYYEALISAGANFASAPKRVLIDMLDPIIVAESIAYTPVDRFIPLASIISNTREGINGIGGVQTRGQYREGMPGI